MFMCGVVWCDTCGLLCLCVRMCAYVCACVPPQTFEGLADRQEAAKHKLESQVAELKQQLDEREQQAAADKNKRREQSIRRTRQNQSQVSWGVEWCQVVLCGMA